MFEANERNLVKDTWLLNIGTQLLNIGKGSFTQLNWVLERVWHNNLMINVGGSLKNKRGKTISPINYSSCPCLEYLQGAWRLHSSK